jgi:CRISPR/Cas system CSM-associated protein Csm2 small subunit
MQPRSAAEYDSGRAVDREADERAHAIDEAVSALYRGSPQLAKTMPREKLRTRVEQFIRDLEEA